jgi:hypothetical protein
MKNLTKRLLALTAVVSAFSISSYGQATETANASATIVIPISIEKVSDMDFGNVAVQAANGGTVELDPAGSRTPVGGVTLPSITGTVSAASFTVSGTPNYTYSITLPNSVTIEDAFSNSMTVDVFTSDPSSTGQLSSGGSETLNVGATLNVSAAQPAGLYTSTTPFTVTVNYN